MGERANSIQKDQLGTAQTRDRTCTQSVSSCCRGKCSTKTCHHVAKIIFKHHYFCYFWGHFIDFFLFYFISSQSYLLQEGCSRNSLGTFAIVTDLECYYGTYPLDAALCCGINKRVALENVSCAAPLMKKELVEFVGRRFVRLFERWSF